MSFIKKKNLKAKKGKEKWRKNIDITEIQDTIAEENEKIHYDVAKKRKLPSKKPAYFIDTEPVSSNVPKGLDPDRFKKKIKGELSKTNKKLLKIYSKKIQQSKKNAKLNETIEKNGKDENVWDEKEKNISKQVVLPHETKIGNSLPLGGQSYNPSFKDHKNFLEEIQHNEIEKKSIKHAISNKVNKKRKRPQKKLTEKELNHQFTLIKKFTKEMKEKEGQSLERIKEKEKRKEIEKQELEMGLVKKPKRIGKNVYEPKIPDFKLSSELSSNLRTINPEGSVLKDAFDNLFKKKKIEPGNPFGRKKQKSRVAKYKYHNVDRKNPSKDDKILGSTFNIYQY